MAESASSAPMMTDTKTGMVPSDRAVAVIMHQGLQDILVQTVGGAVVGGMAGVVLARGGGGTAARKVLAGLGGGVGFGAAWTRTSMNLEELLAPVVDNETRPTN